MIDDRLALLDVVRALQQKVCCRLSSYQNSMYVSLRYMQNYLIYNLKRMFLYV